MHRSGTSLLIGLLEIHGFQLGEVSHQTSKLKPTGTKENLAIRSINNQIFSSANSDWKSPKLPVSLNKSLTTKIKSQVYELSKLKQWALKDPRMVFTYPIWQNYMGNHKIIGTVRRPIDVALSLNKKNALKLNEGMEIWYRYNLQLLDLWEQHKFPLVVFGIDKESYLNQVNRAFSYLNINFEHHKAQRFYQHQNKDYECSEETPDYIQKLFNRLTKIASEESFRF